VRGKRKCCGQQRQGDADGEHQCAGGQEPQAGESNNVL